VLNCCTLSFLCACAWRRIAVLILWGGLAAGLGSAAEAQHLRVGAGAGWAFYTNNVTLETTTPSRPERFQLDVDLKAGPQVYVSAGFVRSIGDNFELGGRLRGHVSRIRSDAGCGELECQNPEGALRIGTLEGRIILTSVEWIEPYLLVGLGVAHTSLDGVTVRDGTGQELSFPEISIVDAGGDVGIGASLPLVGGLAVDAEIRAAGSLPGGKDNTVTAAPFTLGVSYEFD